MEALLSWQNLVFYVPIAFGAILAIGAAFGLMESGADAGPDGDGPDADGGGGADAEDGFSLLALGRVPLTVRLMLLTFSFGGIGVVTAAVLQAVMGGSGVASGLVAVAVAGVGSVALSAGVARFLVRRLPTFETETIRREELVGSTGRVVLRASHEGGAVQLRDRRGNLHQVGCRTQAGELVLPAGTEVLLVDYRPDTRTFLVVKSPLAL